jgi:hypothetical protein
MTNEHIPHDPDEDDWHEPDQDDWPDEPYADPVIRADYQLAVGRLIIAHTEVDFWMSALLTKATKKIDPTGGLDELTKGDFNQRATYIELIMKVVPNIALGRVGNGRLIELNRIRNIIAHSHFDQDRYEGDFKLVLRKYRSHKIEQLTNINAKVVNDAAAELEDVASHMETVNIFFDIQN